MPCFNPIKAWQSQSGKIAFHNKNTLGGPNRPSRVSPDFRRELQIPCGQCIGCRIDKADNWATRCMHEAKMHDVNSFLTLTIDPSLKYLTSLGKTTSAQAEQVTQELRGSLNKRTHQLFLKRLRKLAAPNKIKFYMCGEYGDQYKKPHYHYLIFGYRFQDQQYFKKSKSGEALYTSKTLETIWPFGHAWIGDVTMESCQYVARYVLKKLTGPQAEKYNVLDDDGNEIPIQPEFCLMSRNPGIGAGFYEKYYNDIWPQDKIWIFNKSKKVPRYYTARLEKANKPLHDKIKGEREAKALQHADDNTPARLDAKEQVTKAKYRLSNRDLTS